MTLLAHIHGALHAKKFERARMLTLLGVGAAEQFSLDENWATAWRLTGLETPNWTEWAHQNLGQIRKEYSRSRAVDKMWVAAVIAEQKDDDYLMKRRGHHGKPADKGNRD